MVIEIYEGKIGKSAIQYRCICFKDWYDLQSKIQQAGKLINDEKLGIEVTKEEADKIATDIEEMKKVFIVKYMIEPKVSLEDIEDMDMFVYNSMFNSIVEKAIPKNSL